MLTNIRRIIALSDGRVTGLFSEGSGPGRCPGSGGLPVFRVSTTHPIAAWRPNQPSLLALYWKGCSNRAPDRLRGRAGALYSDNYFPGLVTIINIRKSHF